MAFVLILGKCWVRTWISSFLHIPVYHSHYSSHNLCSWEKTDTLCTGHKKCCELNHLHCVHMPWLKSFSNNTSLNKCVSDEMALLVCNGFKLWIFSDPVVQEQWSCLCIEVVTISFCNCSHRQLCKQMKCFDRGRNHGELNEIHCQTSDLESTDVGVFVSNYTNLWFMLIFAVSSCSLWAVTGNFQVIIDSEDREIREQSDREQLMDKVKIYKTSDVRWLLGNTGLIVFIQTEWREPDDFQN
jgi:hypothetical protein